MNIALCRPILKEIWKSGITHILLDCTIEIIEDVLRQAQQIGLMTNEYHYIITNLDLHTLDLTPYQYSETNITGIRFINPESEVLRSVAFDIYDQNPSYDQYIVGWKIQLEVALIYDAMLMLAEAITTTPIVQPESLNCSDNVGGWKSGQTVVNIMKSVSLEH